MKILSLIFLISFIFPSYSKARLLDKIMAVVNDKTITLSQVRRVRKNIKARKNISPQIYKQDNYSDRQIVDIFINRNIIRDKLTDLGYVINDDQVESQIKQTEKRLGLTRDSLMDFLKSNNTTFDEYFETIRETIEYNIFISRVINPLISITDQEVKNTFYKKNMNNKTFSFKYELVDFSLQQNAFKGPMLKNFKEVLEKFQLNGILPHNFSKVSTNSLGKLTEEGLNENLRKLLKLTDEGNFSEPLKMGNAYHIFYVKKKDLVESEKFNESKNRIRGLLFNKASQGMKTLWFERESNKHYIKYFN